MKRAAGFVLAGGKSSRMGRNKALLPYRGATLIEHVAGIVRSAAGSVTLVGPRHLYENLGLPVIEDATPESGPLAGLEAALLHTTAGWNLVVACDMPAVPSEFLQTLLAAADLGQGNCVAASPSPGSLQPLCAVYHRECLPAVRQALRQGRRRTTSILNEFRVIAVPVANPAWLENLNTQADWSSHRHTLEIQAPSRPVSSHD